jgi:hypothetical protein
MQKYPVPPLGIRRVRSQTGKMKISLRALLLATLTTNAVALLSPLDITVPAVFTSSCHRDPGAICGFLVTSCIIASKDAARTRVRLAGLCGGAAVW